jgi:hypothetical protein
MSKINEIYKPRLTKEEAATLFRLIYRRFAEILEQGFKECINDDCEECYLNEDCPVFNYCDPLFTKVIEGVESLGIHIWYDWESEYIILQMSWIKPDQDDDKWIWAYELKKAVWVSVDELKNVEVQDQDFEPVTIADIRDEYRSFHKIFADFWIEDALTWLFRA